MSACPCCLEVLRPALLGLGGRRLVGTCAVCGDAVCQACLHPGTPASRGRSCGSCVWEAFAARGQQPSFPEPAGRRRRAAQAACAHPRAVRWMQCCPTCGADMAWEAQHDNPVCNECGAPSHPAFNCCWACGESFGEENDTADSAEGYDLAFDCRSRRCQGRVAWLMPYCPWCATAQRWQPSGAEDAPACVGCEATLEPTWAFCVSCGEEAPLPEDCFECARPLDQAECAARCEHCERMVCGECFERGGKDGSRGGDELLLCTTCWKELGAAAAPDEEAPAAEPDADEARRGGDTPSAAREVPPGSPWEVLGVAPGTSLPEVKQAYLTLISQYHPDKVAQLGPKLQALATEETRRLNLAWSELRKRPG